MSPPDLPEPRPSMVVDAGAEPWERIEPLLVRRFDELPPSAALDLLSTEPAVRDALIAWCRRHGYQVVSPAEEPVPSTATGAPVIRIRKNPPLWS